MKKLFFLFFSVALVVAAKAQPSDVIRKYIDTYREAAIEEMLRTGVPAAITLAQGIHETGAGQSDLVRKSNNHFGIKCKSEWKGEAVYHDDDARGECFRKYNDPIESYRDHSDFLRNRPYYASLFKLDPTDYEAWAYGLKKAGYATNPRYPQILIKLIRDFGLQEYTLLALERREGKGGDAVVLVNQSTGAAQATDEAVQPAIQSYPSGKFTINETEVLYIKKGTSYLAVAEENNLSVARLFEFNDLKGQDIAATDHLLFLKRKRKVGSRPFHVVQEGETLHDIAQVEGIRQEYLLLLNGLKEGMMPRVGEKLYLQEPAPQMPRLLSDREAVQPPPAVAEAEYQLYQVQPKETLYAIARKFEVSVEDLQAWNKLQSQSLHIGQQLRIYKKAAHGTH